MKKTLLKLLLLCMLASSTAVKAQEYIPMLTENKVWAVVTHFYPNPGNMQTTFYKVDGDSLVNAQVYKKIYSSTDESQTNWNKKGLLSEENQKIKILYENEEFLLYDFSVEENDIFSINSMFLSFNNPYSILEMHVDSVKYIDFAGKTRKHIYLTNLMSMPGLWIEGIGSYYGFWYNVDPGTLGGDYYKLQCYYENNELVYHNDYYSSCYVATAVPEQSFKNTNVEVNTANETVTVTNYSTNAEIHINIYNIYGNLLKIIKSNNTQEIINYSNFISGLYIITISQNNSIKNSIKIIKK